MLLELPGTRGSAPYRVRSTERLTRRSRAVRCLAQFRGRIEVQGAVVAKASALEWGSLRAVLRSAVDDPVVSDWFSSVIPLNDVHPPVNAWPEVLDLIADTFADNVCATTRRRDHKSATSWHALATETRVSVWVDVLLQDLWTNSEDDPRPAMPDHVLRHLRAAIQRTRTPDQRPVQG